jgi:CubicO group peptidase (beta-lactamase class C family)
VPNWIVGDGNIFTSLDDLARYDAALRAGKVVKPQTLKLLCKAGELDDGTRVDYAFGLVPGKSHGRRMVEHSGSWAGTATFIRREVPRGFSYIVLSNDDSFDASALADRLAPLFIRAERDDPDRE